MTYDQPFYRRSPDSLFQSHTTRILISLAGCMGLLLLLLHLPISTSPPRVGWTADRSGDLIALSQIAVEDEESPSPEDAEATSGPDTPPPTRHGPPTPSEAHQSPDTDNDETEAAEESSSDEPASSDVRSIAALSSKDRHPEIMGGRGALNLFIEYPTEARKKGIEGQLKLSFTVGTDGNARRIRVSKSLHPLCDSAAVQAVRSVRFRPGTYEGEPVPVRMSLPIRFQLQPNPDRLHSSRTPNAEN